MELRGCGELGSGQMHGVQFAVRYRYAASAQNLGSESDWRMTYRISRHLEIVRASSVVLKLSSRIRPYDVRKCSTPCSRDDVCSYVDPVSQNSLQHVKLLSSSSRGTEVQTPKLLESLRQCFFRTYQCACLQCCTTLLENVHVPGRKLPVPICFACIYSTPCQSTDDRILHHIYRTNSDGNAYGTSKMHSASLA